MASVNKAIILGNVGQDVELRYMPNGDAAVNLSVATSRAWKNKDGEKQEETEWHRVSLFGKLAEIAGEYVKKGKPVYIEGRLKTRKWTDKEGVEKYTTEIIAEQLVLLGGRDEQPAKTPAKQAEKPKTHGEMKKRAANFDDEPPF